ncbi:MAG: B12-binding domain-containing radical SAM protein [Burkholderiaceae bacterium]|jgi:radical SAM superfamily enzyme YgiQ (UPF0313 family)|nr:B12-binding domain-containing radical SAM protein [Burkholderiaceae bacterium]
MKPLRTLSLIRPNMGDWRSSDAFTPLALAILAARTPADVQVRLFDERLEAIPADDCPDLAAITVETFTARRAYAIADAYRARGVPVVLGGYHPSALPQEALNHADAVAVGDAEGSWETLIDDFRQGCLQPIYGGGNRRPLDDVRLDRRLFAGKPYVPIQLVQFGRGCRFACDFCSIRSFYPEGTRVRPLASLVDELEQLDRRRLVLFVDDNLFSSRPQLDALLRAITPLRLRWACQISIDAARDDVLLDRMREAGCRVALIGFESMDPANLKQMGKPWNKVAGSYLDVVKKFHARGIALYGTFVFGYDHDTVDSVRRSLDFALQARLDIVNLNPLTPTPGSPLYERLHGEGRLLWPQWWTDPGYRYGAPIFTPRRMSAQQLADECFAAKREYYAWRHIAARIARPVLQRDVFQTTVVALANYISRKEVMRKQDRTLGGGAQPAAAS